MNSQQEFVQHPIEQVTVWADDYEKAGGHALVVQMLRSYAQLLAAAPTPPNTGDVVVTTDETGYCAVAVTRQDEEGQILSVIWEAPTPPAQEDEPVARVSSIRNDIGYGTIAILKKDSLCPSDYLYTRPADDKLRKAAEEILPFIVKLWPLFLETRLLDNLRAALKGKS